MHTYILLHYISLEYLYSYPPNNLSHLAQPRPKSLPYSYSYYLSPSLVYPATFNFNKCYLYPTTPYYFLLTKQTYLPILSISTLPCYLPPCLSYIHTFIHPTTLLLLLSTLSTTCMHTYIHAYIPGHAVSNMPPYLLSTQSADWYPSSIATCFNTNLHVTLPLPHHRITTTSLLT